MDHDLVMESLQRRRLMGESSTESGSPLYHVGCGRFVISFDPEATIAIACICGAGSPILVPDLEDLDGGTSVIPGSLIRGVLIGEEEPPHLEYYLGYSDFNCPAKEAWRKVLVSLKGISAFDCYQDRCRGSAAVQRDKALAMLERYA